MIAKELGVHPSTICRELKRHHNSIHGYNAELAQVQSTELEKYLTTSPVGLIPCGKLNMKYFSVK